MSDYIKKRIKSYAKYSEKCGIAKQVEGKVVDAKRMPSDYPTFANMWMFEYGGERWVASDYDFEED